MAARKDGKQGHKADKLIGDALRRAANRYYEGKSGPKKLEMACDAVMDKAVNGDVLAFNVVADRIDGKPQQETHATINQTTTIASSRVSELDRFFGEVTKNRKNGANKNPLPN